MFLWRLPLWLLGLAWVLFGVLTMAQAQGRPQVFVLHNASASATSNGLALDRKSTRLNSSHRL